MREGRAITKGEREEISRKEREKKHKPGKIEANNIEMVELKKVVEECQSWITDYRELTTEMCV